MPPGSQPQGKHMKAVTSVTFWHVLSFQDLFVFICIFPVFSSISGDVFLGRFSSGDVFSDDLR